MWQLARLATGPDSDLALRWVCHKYVNRVQLKNMVQLKWLLSLAPMNEEPAQLNEEKTFIGKNSLSLSARWHALAVSLDTNNHV